MFGLRLSVSEETIKICELMTKICIQMHHAVLFTIGLKVVFMATLNIVGEREYATRDPDSVYNLLLPDWFVYDSSIRDVPNWLFYLYSIISLFLSRIGYMIYQILYTDIISDWSVAQVRKFAKRIIPSLIAIKMFFRTYPRLGLPLLLTQSAMIGACFSICIMKILYGRTAADMLLVYFLEIVTGIHLFMLYASYRLMRNYIEPEEIREYLRNRIDDDDDQEEQVEQVELPPLPPPPPPPPLPMPVELCEIGGIRRKSPLIPDGQIRRRLGCFAKRRCCAGLMMQGLPMFNPMWRNFDPTYAMPRCRVRPAQRLNDLSFPTRVYSREI